MSGHSKWATTRRKKAVIDGKRGKIFTKITREIIVAARSGGGDINGNSKLRLAVDKAKAANMPAENWQRAIKKGTGDLEGVSYEPLVYEGYGPGGVAVVVDALTDNKNRSASDIRSLFTKNGGNLGEPGSVAWMFKRKGLIVLPKAGQAEDQVMEWALEAGAEDMTTGEETYDVVTAAEDFEKVRQALAGRGLKPTSAEITFIPANTIRLEGDDAQRMLRLMDALEDNDDVQNVYANFDIPQDVMDAME